MSIRVIQAGEITAIDGGMVSMPSSQMQIEMIVQRIGDEAKSLPGTYQEGCDQLRPATLHGGLSPGGAPLSRQDPARICDRGRS